MHEPESPARRVQFGPFELDLRSGELWKGSTRVKVPRVYVRSTHQSRPPPRASRRRARAAAWSDSPQPMDSIESVARGTVGDWVWNMDERPDGFHVTGSILGDAAGADRTRE